MKTRPQYVLRRSYWHRREKTSTLFSWYCQSKLGCSLCCPGLLVLCPHVYQQLMQGNYCQFVLLMRAMAFQVVVQIPTAPKQAGNHEKRGDSPEIFEIPVLVGVCTCLFQSPAGFSYTTRICNSHLAAPATGGLQAPHSTRKMKLTRKPPTSKPTAFWLPTWSTNRAERRTSTTSSMTGSTMCELLLTAESTSLHLRVQQHSQQVSDGLSTTSSARLLYKISMGNHVLTTFGWPFDITCIRQFLSNRPFRAGFFCSCRISYSTR